MQIRAVYPRQRDSPTDEHTAPERHKVVSSNGKAETEHTEPFRAVLCDVVRRERDRCAGHHKP